MSKKNRNDVYSGYSYKDAGGKMIVAINEFVEISEIKRVDVYELVVGEVK